MMERCREIVKRIITLFLFIIVVGGAFSNYSLGSLLQSYNVSITLGNTKSFSLPSYLQGIGTNNLSCIGSVPGWITASVNGGSVVITAKATCISKMIRVVDNRNGNAAEYYVTTSVAKKPSTSTKKKETKKSSSSSNSNSGSSSNNNSGNNNYYYYYTYVPTVTYSPSLKISSVDKQNTDEYMKKRKISFKITATDMKDYSISVKGKSLGKMDVKGSKAEPYFYTTKNDTFTIKVSGTGKDGEPYSKTKTIEVRGLDTTKPKVKKFNRVTTRGTNVVKLELTLTDNKRLGLVKVYDPDGKVIKEHDYGKNRTGGSTGDSQKLTVKNITKKGKYKFEISDEAGNLYKYTKEVHVDTTPPKVKAFSVTKVADKGKSISTEDKGVTSISATTGDQILLKIWTHEMLSEKENPTIKIDGKTIKELGGKIEVNTKKNSSDQYLAKVTFTMSDKLTNSKYLPITITNRSDLWNNKTDTEIKYDNMLYYDANEPKIKSCTFSATTYAGEEISSKFIQITDKNTIKVSFIVEEILAKNPIVTLMGVKNTIKSTTYNKVESGYKYETEFKFTEEQINASQTKGIQEVTISNCVDKAGNTLPEVKYTEDNDKKVIMTTGLIDGGIYLDINSPTQGNLTEFKLGDVNKNGYITSFDYLYEKVHLNELSTDVGDINQDKNINEKDLIALSDMLNNTRTVVKGNSIKIKLYAYQDNDYKIGTVNSFEDIILSDNVELDRENSNLSEGIVAIKLLNDQENVTIRVGKLYGVIRLESINIIEKPEESEEIDRIEEIKRVTEGCLVAEDREMPYKKIKIAGKTEGNIREGYHACDFNNDGIVTLYDSLMINTFMTKGYDEESEEYKMISEYADSNEDDSIDITDATFIKMALVDQYSKVIKGDSVTLKFRANNGQLTANETRYDSLEWKSLDENIATVVDNGDKTATVKAVGTVGQHTQILVKAIKDGEIISATTFNIEIDDLEIDMQKMVEDETTSEEADIKELTLNLTDKESAKLSIGNIDTEGKTVTWEIEDENIATYAQNQDGTITIEAKKIGETKLAVTVLGEDGNEYKAKINLYVENNIEKVALVHNGEVVTENPIKLKTLDVYDFSVVTFPLVTSETYEINIDNGEVLELTSNNEGYTIKALEEGTANIVIKAEKGETRFPVQVIANTNPEIINITAQETNKNLKAGEKITITVEFDKNIKGDVPDMKLYFDDSDAVGNIEGTIDGNKIIYTYEIAEEDNGQLYIGDIILPEGKILTDETGNVDANLDKSNLDLIEPEDIEVPEDESTEDTEDTEGIETEHKELLYKAEGIYIWQIAPEITVVIDTSNDSYSVNDGDTVTIYMRASQELKENPVLKIAGQEVKSTGEGTEFEAKIKISKEKVPEGILDIEIGEITDIYNNIGNAIKVNDIENINTVIVDYTAPMIDSISVDNYTENSKAGDKIQIKVTFADKTKGTTELIQVPTKEENGEVIYEFPILKLAFAGKEAKGEITAEFEEMDMDSIILEGPDSMNGENSGDDEQNEKVAYSSSIIYTYTLTDEDKENISINSIKGTVYDMAGNETQIDYTNDENLDKDTNDNTNNNKGNISQNKNDKDNMAIGRLPYTGAAVGTGIVSIIIGVVSLILRKRFFIK